MKRGIFKGEMNRNISPLNGVLPTLPLLAKWVAAAAAKHPHEINIRGPKVANETGGSGTRPYKNMCHARRWHCARRVVVRHEELWPHTAPTQFDILVVIFATKNS